MPSAPQWQFKELRTGFASIPPSTLNPDSPPPPGLSTSPCRSAAFFYGPRLSYSHSFSIPRSAEMPPRRAFRVWSFLK